MRSLHAALATQGKDASAREVLSWSTVVDISCLPALATKLGS